VVYWMQRSQRAADNDALNIAIAAGNELRKPVLVFFQLLAPAHHANLRHYEFMQRGLAELLRKRNVGFVLRADPDDDFLRFCAEVHPCLVIGDENPLRGAERAKARIAAELRIPFWTVDADLIVPSRMLGKKHYAARTIRPKIHALLPTFLKPTRDPMAKVKWRGGMRSVAPGANLLDRIPLERSIAPVSKFAGGNAAAQKTLRRFLRDRLNGYAAPA